jgi:hypothetical protein
METGFNPLASDEVEDNSKLQSGSQSVYNDTTVSVESSPAKEPFSPSMLSLGM